MLTNRTPVARTLSPTFTDPEAVARRVNGAVAADRQAQALRRDYVQQIAHQDQDLGRRLERIEAAIVDLLRMMAEARR